jgi:hypothetical protein
MSCARANEKLDVRSIEDLQPTPHESCLLSPVSGKKISEQAVHRLLGDHGEQGAQEGSSVSSTVPVKCNGESAISTAASAGLLALVGIGLATCFMTEKSIESKSA